MWLHTLTRIRRHPHSEPPHAHVPADVRRARCHLAGTALPTPTPTLPLRRRSVARTRAHSQTVSAQPHHNLALALMHIRRDANACHPLRPKTTPCPSSGATETTTPPLCSLLRRWRRIRIHAREALNAKMN